MKVSEDNTRKNYITNYVIEQRRVLEISIDRKMRIARLKKFEAIKQDYYRRNPTALRFVPIVALDLEQETLHGN